MNVLLTGTNFIEGISSVSFGSGISVDSIAVLGSTQLRVWLSISLAAPSEPRDICVSNAGPGGGTATLVGGFGTTTPAPRITSVSPSIGARGKSMIVTIRGSDFISGTSTVSLGDKVTIDSVLVANSTQIGASLTVARDAIVGTRHVTVSNTDPGSGSSSLPNAFEVQNPPPIVTGITPSTCSLGQALSVTLAGEGFLDGVSSIDLGAGFAVNSLACDNNGTHIIANICVSLGAITGVRSIVVTNVGPGGGSTTLAASFTIVNPPPSLLSISPAAGERGKTLDVALSGTNYISGTTRVEFGVGVKVNSVSVKSPTKIMANITVSPDAIIGARGIVVVNPPPGGGSGKIPHVFNVEIPTPVIAGVSPVGGLRGERLSVTIKGANFFPGVTSALFGPGIAMDSIAVTSPEQLSANVIIGEDAPLGWRTIVVTNSPPGGGSASLTKAFTITDCPVTSATGPSWFVPDHYILQEAYPNPFNPRARIRYGLPERSRVKLEVCNVLGIAVAVLEDSEQARGYHEREWIADVEPSGVYLVRLFAESRESSKRYVASKKVVVLK
jgi:hypothetical protein